MPHPTRDAALASGLDLFGRGRRRGLRYSRWRHTYFERLTGSYINNGHMHTFRSNRLLAISEKMGQWTKASEAGLYAHTALDSDRIRTRGSPCLQYLQIRTIGTAEFSVTALYRSHDYANKALGNLIGISRISQFLENYSDRRCTKISVISNNPHSGLSKASLKAYIEDVRATAGI